MDTPLVLVTGFGSFERVSENPSGRIALALDTDPPSGLRVRGVELPVSFEHSRRTVDDALAELPSPGPQALLSLGVHPGPSFRIETRARAIPRAGRPDNDGVAGDQVEVTGGPDLITTFDPERLRVALLETALVAALEVTLSDDAGGYVCEWIYRHVLEVGESLGIPALFLHVPPLEHCSLEEQIATVRRMMTAIMPTIMPA